MNLPVMAAQSVAVERAGEAEKHFAASIHQTMTSIDNCADKRHYVNLSTPYSTKTAHISALPC